MELIAQALKDIRHSLIAGNCAHVTLFIVNAELQKQLSIFRGHAAQTQFGLTMQRFSLDGGKWIDGICPQEQEIQAPGFKKPEDVKNGIKK